MKIRQHLRYPLTLGNQNAHGAIFFPKVHWKYACTCVTPSPWGVRTQVGPFSSLRYGGLGVVDKIFCGKVRFVARFHIFAFGVPEGALL